MRKNIFLLLLLFIPIGHFGQTEKFVDAKTIEKQKLSTSKDKQQEIIEYIEKTEERHAEKRSENSLDNVIQKESADQETNLFDLPEQVHKFEKINAIVLDAGHGGKDPGGVANGIEEKRLVLTMVKKLHTLFRKNNRKLKIYVTRKNDSFVSLEDRVSKTARWSSRQNVIFVSIHGNISLKPSISGFEIYTLSDRASDSEALATERLENAGFTPDDIEQTDSTYSLLADLIRDGTRKESEWLAEYVYDDTLKTSHAYGRGLKRANFFVLKYNTVPSILVEIGYMSNKSEAKKLEDEEYQNKLAVGIYKGISRYINDYNESEGFTKWNLNL